MSSSNPPRVNPIDRPLPKGKAEVMGSEKRLRDEGGHQFDFFDSDGSKHSIFLKKKKTSAQPLDVRVPLLGDRTVQSDARAEHRRTGEEVRADEEEKKFFFFFFFFFFFLRFRPPTSSSSTSPTPTPSHFLLSLSLSLFLSFFPLRSQKKKIHPGSRTSATASAPPCSSSSAGASAAARGRPRPSTRSSLRTRRCGGRCLGGRRGSLSRATRCGVAVVVFPPPLLLSFVSFGRSRGQEDGRREEQAETGRSEREREEGERGAKRKKLSAFLK